MNETNNIKDPKDEQPGNDFENIPTAGNELVGDLMHSIVSRRKTDDDEASVLTHICFKVVEKALTGDIEACKLVFDRVSGYSVQPVISLDKETNLSVDKDRDLETQVGIS